MQPAMAISAMDARRLPVLLLLLILATPSAAAVPSFPR